MFAVGASRGLIANLRWWKAGLEMLGLGAVVAALAYASGPDRDGNSGRVVLWR